MLMDRASGINTTTWASLASSLMRGYTPKRLYLALETVWYRHHLTECLHQNGVNGLSLLDSHKSSISGGFRSAILTPLYILCWLFSSGNLPRRERLPSSLHNVPHYRKIKDCANSTTLHNKGALLKGHFGLLNWQKGNCQSLNTERVRDLKNTKTICLGKTNELSPAWSMEITR